MIVSVRDKRNIKQREKKKPYVVTIELLKTMLVTVVGAAVKVFCYSISFLLSKSSIRGRSLQSG